MSGLDQGGDDRVGRATAELADQPEWSRYYRTVRKRREPPCHRLPATILAEAYTAYAHGGRWRPEQTPLSDDGGIELLVTDEWLAYDIEATAGRRYAVSFSIAAADGFGGGDIGIVVDGDPQHRLSFDSTGGWNAWDEITTAIDLPAGQHTLKLVVLEGGWKLAGLTLR